MSDALAPILAHWRAEPSRTGSLVITVYGDAIVPRGGAVWLGTMLTFFRALDIGDGVVRTAMSRLAADGWLERSRVGRNSYYRLADKGREAFREASERIYARTAPKWLGHFDLALGGDKATLEREGYAPVAPGVWIAPGGAPAVEGALRLKAGGDDETLREVAARAWRLEATAQAYARFLATFAPLRATLERGASFAPQDAFAARILMIHEYRRIVLRDPGLPVELLPPNWPGTAARRLCAFVYARVAEASERWLDEEALGEDGLTLAARPDIIGRRFAD